MKKILLLVVLSIALSVPAQARMASETFSTGRDWTTRMSMGEKYLSVLVPMTTLHQYGVPFRLKVQDYIPAIDYVLEHNPHLLDEDVANILASTVYLFEPQSRPSLDSLETKFLQGDYSFMPEAGLRILQEME